MKKILSLLLAVTLLLSSNMLVFAENVKPVLKVVTVTTAPSSNVKVPITITGNTGICGATINISYDTNLILTGVEKGDAFSSMELTKSGDLSVNPVRLVWDSMEADTSNGTIAYLVFTTPSVAGTYPISIQYHSDEVIDGDLLPVALNIENGEILVEENSSTTEPDVPVISVSITSIDSIAYNKLKINWTKVETADGYLIYKQESDGRYSTLKNVVGGDTTSYTTTVTSGVEYTYKVAAYQLSGTQKVILAESAIQSQTALPAAPSLTNADMAAYNKIRLQWTKVSGCEGYVIYRSTEENGTYKVLKSLAEPATVAYVNVVTSPEDYYYKMRAYVTVDGNKVYGNYSNVMMGNVISGPPANITVKQVTGTKIKFTWDKVDDAEGYVIYMATEKDGTYKATKNITDINTLTYNKNVSEGQTYYFYMKSYRITADKKVYSQPTEIFSNK